MKSCRICGKTDKETRIINSAKYGMNLCRYHYKEMCNKHLDANNLIKDNYIIINNIKFYFDLKYLSLIKSNKWKIKYKTNSINGKIPYLVNTSGQYLINKIYGKSYKGELYFGSKGYTYYTSDNILNYNPKSFKVSTNEFGYKGIYKSQIFPTKYRFNIVINNKLISTKEFPRLELVIYLAYLVNEIIFNDKSYEDDITKKYLSKLNIVDKENIENYFIKKFISLDYKYAKRYTEYKRDIKYNNMIERSNKSKFYNDL
jgi:hypothetical protein